MRRGDNNLAKHTLLGKKDGHRPMDRTPMRWADQMLEITQCPLLDTIRRQKAVMDGGN